MTIVLTSLVPFDFRVDVERMAELKALPIRASRLAIGQLIAPVVLMTALQWTALGVLALRLGDRRRPLLGDRRLRPAVQRPALRGREPVVPALPDPLGHRGGVRPPGDGPDWSCWPSPSS